MDRCAKGDNDTLAELDQLYQTAWPGDADEGGQAYTFEANLPPGFEPSHEHREAAVATFTRLGVPPDQARQLESIFLTAASRDLSEAAHEAMKADTLAQLAGELGGEDAAAAFVADAAAFVRAVEASMWPGLRLLIQEHGAGNDLELVRAVGRLARHARQGRAA